MRSARKTEGLATALAKKIDERIGTAFVETPPIGLIVFSGSGVSADLADKPTHDRRRVPSVDRQVQQGALKHRACQRLRNPGHREERGLHAWRQRAA
jgi:hypothetical protein